MMDDVERAIVALVRGQMRESIRTREALPWWRRRLRFANLVAASACGRLAKSIIAGGVGLIVAWAFF